MTTRARQKLVIVGNGMAGMRTVEEVLARDPDRYNIEVIGAEPHPNYNRILLSSVLAGEKSLDEIVLHTRDWYAKHSIRLTSGDAVTCLAIAERSLLTASGATVSYDKLVLATGSRPLAPPIPGLNLRGVCAFRTIADLEIMRAASTPGARAVVVGGGLLGLEAAWGLTRRGWRVTVLHLMRTLMERQLDEAAALLLQGELVARGVEIITNAHTEAILGDGAVNAVQLGDGRELRADLVVLAIGVRPDIELARKAKLDVNRGIIVDDAMMTSDSRILAVGECAEHRGVTYGLVGPLWEQASICARTLCEPSISESEARAPYVAPTLFTSLKITGVNVFSAGALSARDDGDEEITLRDPTGGLYKKLVLRDDKLVGAVLYGDIADGPWFVEWIDSRRDTNAVRDQLVFGRAFAAAA